MFPRRIFLTICSPIRTASAIASTRAERVADRRNESFRETRVRCQMTRVDQPAMYGRHSAHQAAQIIGWTNGIARSMHRVHRDTRCDRLPGERDQPTFAEPTTVGEVVGLNAVLLCGRIIVLRGRSLVSRSLVH